MEDEIRKLRMENDLLKKCSGLLRLGAELSGKSALTETGKADYPVRWMCQMLEAPRSSFDAWRERACTETATAERRRLLAEQVRRVFDEQRQTAGSRSERGPSSTTRAARAASAWSPTSCVSSGLELCSPAPTRRPPSW
jgi:hypothetical protein